MSGAWLFAAHVSVTPSQVLKAASNRARDAIFDEIRPPVSFAFWRCSWQDFKLLAPLLLLVAFIDMVCVPMFLIVLLSGFRSRQVLSRLCNSRGGYSRIIAAEFLEVLAVVYDVAAFCFVIALLSSAAPMLAQLYDAFLLRSPAMARAAVRSNVKSSISSTARFVSAMFTCKHLVNSVLFALWFFFLPPSVAFVQLKKRNVFCDFLWAMIIGFGLWICPIICASATGHTADNAARAFLSILCDVPVSRFLHHFNLCAGALCSSCAACSQLLIAKTRNYLLSKVIVQPPRSAALTLKQARFECLYASTSAT
jgi:hypothetical protein